MFTIFRHASVAPVFRLEAEIGSRQFAVHVRASETQELFCRTGVNIMEDSTFRHEEQEIFPQVTDPREERRPAVKWIKAAAVGIIAALVMFFLMIFAIRLGIAPFNVPPSAAMLTMIGINVGPLALLVHLGYGTFWSIALVYWFQEATDSARGIYVALGLWLIMMIVYSPIIGWGFFGFGKAGELPPNSALYLQPGPKYLIATLVLHLIYGWIIGWLNPIWINFKK